MSLRRQRGVSLVEMMVALVLGLVLSAGVIQIYVANKQAYRAADATSRLQENARFAMEVLTRDIRMAGYQGCGGEARTVVNTLDPDGNGYSAFLYDFSVPLGGSDWDTTDSAWYPSLDATVSGSSPVEGSDVISLRGIFDGESATVTGQPSDISDCAGSSYNEANVKVSDPSGFSQGDIVIVSSCSNAAVFQITGTTGTGSDVLLHSTTAATPTPGNATKQLGACYVGTGEVAKITTRSFFIGDNASGVPSLYRKDGSAAAEELVEGVQNMQILYGEDTDLAFDGSANRYRPADDVGDWSRVVSVRISLLLRSPEDNVVSAPQTYTFNDSEVTAADRRLRRVYTTTIGLRNRTP